MPKNEHAQTSFENSQPTIVNWNHKYKSGQTSSLIKDLNQLSNDNETDLRLRNNELGSLKDDELTEVFANLPQRLRSINLGYNQLRCLNSKVLAKAFTTLNLLTSLGLRCNGLGSLASEKLARAFGKLPRNLTSLDLSSNGLEI